MTVPLSKNPLAFADDLFICLRPSHRAQRLPNAQFVPRTSLSTRQSTVTDSIIESPFEGGHAIGTKSVGQEWQRTQKQKNRGESLVPCHIGLVQELNRQSDGEIVPRSARSEASRGSALDDPRMGPWGNDRGLWNQLSRMSVALASCRSVPSLTSSRRRQEEMSRIAAPPNCSQISMNTCFCLHAFPTSCPQPMSAQQKHIEEFGLALIPQLKASELI